jgi:two-component system, NtrC family, sensor kinase
MMLYLRVTFLFFFIGIFFPDMAVAQRGSLTTLQEKRKRLEQQKDYLQDTAYANTINQLAFIYADSYPDSAFIILEGNAERCKKAGYREGEADAYKIWGNAFQTKGNFEQALEFYKKSYELALKIKYRKGLPGILNNIGIIYLNQGNYPEALNTFYETLKAAEAINDKFVIGNTINNIAVVHYYQGKMDEAERDYMKAVQIARERSDTILTILAYSNLGEVNLEQNDPAKALKNLNIAYNLAVQKNNPEMLVQTTNTLGIIYFRLDSTHKAISQFETALQLSREHDFKTAIAKAYNGLAKAKYRLGKQEEALADGLAGLHTAEEMGQAQLQRDANEILASIYESSGDGSNAIKYYKKYKLFSDSLNNLASERAAVTYKAGYELSKKELEFERKNLQQKWLTFSALAALFSLGVIAWIINRNRKRLNHAYHDLQQKNIVIEAQKADAEETLSKLKAAQSQLIQSEKMASLGELTAGIAHEIQNPLNFVNNFSDLNKELIDDMRKALHTGDSAEAISIAADIHANQDKISSHGKRADSIVKGMLQHSRTSSGHKEPIDINVLADEYLRLSYHGLRAKDKSFNVTLKTDFDTTIGKINLIPQDIGRVLLNLYNNAFYAVMEKKKLSGENFEPTISISTRKHNGTVEIEVKDNGTGVPEKVKEKIFQPFFTTKPSGQGTGLGLSLSYDIIKAHGGEMKVKSEDGNGAGFVITLPV